VVGEPFLGPPVDLTGVVEGTFPCPSLARVAVADTAETFPPYPLAYRTVGFVRARGAASRRHTGPLIVGQDLGRERACFPMMEIPTTEGRLRAERGPQGDWQLRQRAFAKQTLRLRSPADQWPYLSIPQAEFRSMQVTAPV
jgi:hypothetical protein